MKNEKGTVNHRSSESKMEKKKCESLKLGPRGLFETIQGLMQFLYIKKRTYVVYTHSLDKQGPHTQEAVANTPLP